MDGNRGESVESGTLRCLDGDVTEIKRRVMVFGVCKIQFVEIILYEEEG